MGYITKVLRPDEKLLAIGKLHWIVYRLAIVSMLVAVVLWFVIGDYGSIHIRGTGEGLEHLDHISSPISLRNTITTK
jgi:hypothetical protein